MGTLWASAALLLVFPVIVLALQPGTLGDDSRASVVVEVLIGAAVVLVFWAGATRCFQPRAQSVTAVMTGERRVRLVTGQSTVLELAHLLAAPAAPAASQRGSLRRAALLGPACGLCGLVVLGVTWALDGDVAAVLTGGILGAALELVWFLVRYRRSAGASPRDRLEHVVIVPILAGHVLATGAPVPAEGVPVEDLWATLRERPQLAIAVRLQIQRAALYPMLAARHGVATAMALWLP